MNIYPDAYFRKVEDINIEFLNKNKIKALLLDVDNTLVDHTKKMTESVKKWAKELKGQGVKLYILSNTNDKEKIIRISKELGIQYHNFAMKPLKRGFKKGQKDLNEKSENIAIVGDQIFTDVIGGKRSKMYTILVDPINKKDFWYTKWKRPIEDRIKEKIKNRIKGENNVLQ